VAHSRVSIAVSILLLVNATDAAYKLVSFGASHVGITVPSARLTLVGVFLKNLKVATGKVVGGRSFLSALRLRRERR
jgi:hypothetical protein